NLELTYFIIGFTGQLCLGHSHHGLQSMKLTDNPSIFPLFAERLTCFQPGVVPIFQDVHYVGLTCDVATLAIYQKKTHAENQTKSGKITWHFQIPMIGFEHPWHP